MARIQPPGHPKTNGTRVARAPSVPHVHVPESVGGGRYRLTRPHGTGRQVWLARARAGGTVVVKFAPSGGGTGEAADLVRSEASTVAGLSHPGLERVLDGGTEPDGLAWLAAEHLVGDTLDVATQPLRDPAARRGAAAVTTFGELLDLVAQMARALHYLHARGLVHGDVTPGNVLVVPSRDGSGPRAVLIDFGFSAREGAPTATGETSGTWGFLAPEVLLGAGATRRSDLWSLGATLHTICTGQPPFTGATPGEVLEAQRRGVPLGLAATHRRVPLVLETVIRRLLSAEPHARYEDGNAVLRELNAYSGGRYPEEPPTGVLTPCPGVAPFVGREDEVDALLARARALASGAPGDHEAVLLVQSTGGLGRSRLLSEVALRAGLEGLVVASTTVAAADPRPLGFVGDLLLGCVDRLAPDAEFAKRHAPILAQARGVGRSGGAGVAAEDPAAAAAALGERLAAAFPDGLRDRAALLVVDDLHLAAPVHVALLTHVARSAIAARREGTGAGRLGVLGAWRVDGRQVADQAPEILARPAGFTATIALGPLGAEPSGALLGWALGGGRPPAEVAARVLPAAEGSPRLLLAAARSLVDGAVVRRDAAGALETDRRALARWRAPADDRQAADGEAAALPELARRALTALALVEAPLSSAVLARTLGVTPAEARGAAARLVGAGLARRVLEAGPVRIALARPAERAWHLRSARDPERTGLMARAATALRASRDEGDRYLEATARLAIEAGDRAALRDDVLQAAACARDEGRPLAALDLLERARVLLPRKDVLRPTLDREAFELELLLGRFGDARARAARLRAGGPATADLARFHLGLARLAVAQGRDTEATEEIDAGIPLAEDAPPAVRAALLERRAFVATRHADWGTATAALAAADATLTGVSGDDADAVRDALTLVRATTLRESDPAQAAQILRDLADRAARRRAELVEGRALANLAAVLRGIGDLAGAAEAGERAVDAATRAGNVLGRARALTTLGSVAFAAGDLRGARGRYLEALGIFTRLDQEREVGRSLINVGTVLAALGAHIEAERHLAEAQAMAERLGDTSGETWAVLNLIFVLLTVGDLPAADGLLARCGRAWSRRFAQPDLRAAHHERIAEHLAATADVKGAAAAYEIAANSYRAAGRPREASRVSAAAAFLLARTGKLEAAARWLASVESLAEWETAVHAALARAALRPAEAEAALAEAEGRLPAGVSAEMRAEVGLARARVAEGRGDWDAAATAAGAAWRQLGDAARALPQRREAAYLADWRRVEVRETLARARSRQRDAVGRHPGDLTAEEFARIAEITRDLARVREVRPLLERILDVAIRLTGAERGFVLLRDEAEGLAVAATREVEGAPVRRAKTQVSTSVARTAMREGRLVVTSNASQDPRYRASRSVHRLSLRSILCAPLGTGEAAVGCLYLDHPFAEDVFGPHAQALVGAFADQAAAALETARLCEDRAAALREAEALRARVEGELTVRTAQLRVAEAVAPAGAGPGAFEGLVGRSPAMREVFRLIERFADSPAPVLILGESGTGKELVARALHVRSRRRAGPLVSENFGAIRGPLALAQLFGHVRGAFTGAERDRVGLFALATGGTLFMDEIGELDAEVQVALLRAIESGEARAVGAEKVSRLDARIVCATNRDLAERVARGDFRQDLFFRLCVLTLTLPPLRERPGDLPLLIEHFRGRVARERGTCPELSPEAREALLRHRWPGNVRELDAEIRRAALVAGAGPVERRHLSAATLGGGLAAPEGSLLAAGKRKGFWGVVRDTERAMLKAALDDRRWNQVHTARALKMDRITLIRKMHIYGLKAPPGLGGMGRPRIHPRPPRTS